MDYAALIAAIDAHCARTGLKPSTVCQYAATNPLLYERLTGGGYCSPKTARRVLDWLEANRPGEFDNVKDNARVTGLQPQVGE